MECSLGKHVTVIAGQNGTQKTVLLGMLSQPFTISDDENPMKNERPLCGGNYKSSFSEKFKLSPQYDKPKSHEWTIEFDDRESYTLASMPRDKNTGEIRFWQKGSREKGSGYIQMPVIYLSLKRLLPIGEEEKIQESETVVLEEDEKQEFKKLHNEILISFDKIQEPKYIESPNKNTLGVDTDTYDWRLNSAGQDNLGKIILALLSFRRLKKMYSTYKGGILAIDELDCTLYPASQVKLLHVLQHYASRYNVQVIFTTHSLTLLEEACKMQEECNMNEARANQMKVLYLTKRDKEIELCNIPSYKSIENRLLVAASNKKSAYRITLYTEDQEARDFIKNILPKNVISGFQFPKMTLSGSTLLEMAIHGIPVFSFPEAMIVLDGDQAKNLRKKRKNRIGNVLCLPGTESPEIELAKMLYGLSDRDKLWDDIGRDYNKQVCFRDFRYESINEDRTQAKEWYASQVEYWGRRGNKVIKKWRELNQEKVDLFQEEILRMYNQFAKKLGLSEL